MTCALYDAKQRLLSVQTFGFAPASVSIAQLQLIEGCFRAFRPASGEIHAALGFFVASFTGRALVENHHDVGAERGLDFHRDLRRQETERAVDVRAKVCAFFGDLAERAKTPDLKTAGIG